MPHYRLCEDLNLTVPGTPRTEKDVSKKKRKQPTRVDCPQCGLSLRDKFVQRKHVNLFNCLLPDRQDDRNMTDRGLQLNIWENKREQNLAPLERPTRPPPPPPPHQPVSVYTEPIFSAFSGCEWVAKTPTNHIVDLLAPSWFYLVLRYLFMFSWRNVDSGPGVISRSLYIAVRTAASRLPIQGILISSSGSSFFF
jgi:hypothetical protein